MGWEGGLIFLARLVVNHLLLSSTGQCAAGVADRRMASVEASGGATEGTSEATHTDSPEEDSRAGGHVLRGVATVGAASWKGAATEGATVGLQGDVEVAVVVTRAATRRGGECCCGLCGVLVHVGGG